ncbi:MAG TPA: SDR family NAD(P)-dependent oxidoreductase, partial [Thermoanaerobaculia bacterium]
MKRLLRQIYDDLSNGRLSQAEALEKVKAIKRQEQAKGAGVLLATPRWEPAPLEPSAAAARNGDSEHHILLGALANVTAEELQRALPQSHCVTLTVEPRQTLAQRYRAAAVAAFEQVQTILCGKPRNRVLVQIVLAGEGEETLLAGLSGLLRTATLENPRVTGQIILTAPGVTTEELTRVLRDEQHSAHDPFVRHERGTRQVLRWHELPEASEAPAPFKDEAVYLITGGAGSLGVLFAKEILEQSRAVVVLAGRSALNDETRAVINGLSSEAGRITYRQADVADREQVARLIAAIQEQHGRLDGILHSAGTIADRFILAKESAEFDEVLAPKVAGTLNLDEASKDLELDFFVLFASFAGALGNVGQADYAAANGFLDQFAAFRNRQVAAGERHGRTRAIDWPVWEAGGMRLDAASRERLQQITGASPMQTATGLCAFRRALALPYDQLLVAEGDLVQMRHALLSGRPVAAAAAAAEDEQTAPLDTERLLEQTQEYLLRECSEVLRVPAQKIDPNAAMEQYGIDSILAMKLTAHLERTFGPLSTTLFFEYQTLAALSSYFVQSHTARLTALFAGSVSDGAAAARAETQRPPAKRITPKRASAPRSMPSPAAESDPIAIIGLSGRYPESIDIDAYWRNLAGGKDCIIEVPKERWDWREYFTEDRTESGHHYSKWGGFIAGVDEFDPLFFNISPKEAKFIDPQERLFLQHAWMAIEDAGYTRASLQLPSVDDLPGQVGVYVGVMYTEYQLFGAEASARGQRLGVAGSAASIANRVSYAFNLHGPSMTLDTMCSSSLAAIHVACQDLKSGRTGLAIAGGVNVSIHPNKYLVLSAGQFISSDGHCQSFGEGGDGYIPGEGVGVVVLKRLSEAERDGDHIYGIIRGSALNHGGKTNGYTVPNPQAQTTAVRRALAESQIDARHVSYVEAHGTGTKLGDPIEIAALSKAFQVSTPETQFCLIGSAKSNIGHAESAAGIAGLTKVLLQMQHRQIVPSLHSAQLNPHIDFGRTPFVVNQSLQSWERPVIDGRTVPRIAGISSFGAGGSNAHMIVEEYDAPVTQAIELAPAVIVLSARTPEQLKQKARDLADFVRPRVEELALASVAYTLQVGREAMEERLALVVSSTAELLERLQAYVNGRENIAGIYEGQVKRNKEALSVFSTESDLQRTIESWIVNGKLSKVVDLWVKGLDVDWRKLYGDARPPRITLPVYPFARERYWIEAPHRPAAAKSTTAAVLHPLLHENTSDLEHQRYSSTFRGDEPFVQDDPATGQRVISAAACLEMARAAVAQARGGSSETTLELDHLAWGQPFAVNPETQIHIAILARDRDRLEFEIYSERAGEEVVHCQGRAVASGAARPAALDLERLTAQSRHADSAQSLVRLDVPETAVADAADYVLHPAVLDAALRAGHTLTGQPDEAQPFALETLRLFGPCSGAMSASIRTTANAADGAVSVDIDLCDQQGNVAAQLRGLRWQQSETAAVAEASLPQTQTHLETARVPQPEPASLPAVTPPAAGRKEIALVPIARPAPAPIELKRAAISLATPGAPLSATTPRPGRAPITLAAAGGESPSIAAAAVRSSVRLFDEQTGIFTVVIEDRGAAGVRDSISHLLQALARVQQEPSLKVLLVHGLERYSSPGGRDEYNAAIEQKLYQALVTFPYPVIATVQSEAIGAGFLAAALCDFMVGSEEASFGFTVPGGELLPSTALAEILGERFGHARADDFLYRATVATGRQLRDAGWTFPLLPSSEVQAYAETLAGTLAAKSRDALRLLKQHLTRQLPAMVDRLTPAEVMPHTIDEPAAVTTIASPSPHLRLNTPTERVLLITVAQAAPRELTAALGEVFAAIRDASEYSAIVLFSQYGDFLSGTAPIPDDVTLDFQRLLLECEVPVVAALTENAQGSAWWIAQCCDAATYSRAGVYAADAIAESDRLAAMATILFAHRFGGDAAREILSSGAAYTGAELERRCAAVIVAERERVLAAALTVAEQWARLPRTLLSPWKARTRETFERSFQSLPAAPHQHDDVPQQPSAPGVVALQTNVVTVTAHPDDVVVVKMEDRDAKNMFSDAFMHGVREAFTHIAQTASYKVVVLTGYDSYFASGGTKEGLLAIQQGAGKFTDDKVFQLPLECRLPVVAAMQGHGIGAGWPLGFFADLVLLSEESRYVSPYMNYGFTPGAGATYILAETIGTDLARESLLTAEPFTGRELKRRGLRVRVLPRAEVLPAALELASRIARLPHGALTALKRQWTARHLQSLDDTYRRELEMHEQTFVGKSETLAQIETNFQETEARAGEVAAKPAVAVAEQPARDTASESRGDALASVTATLRTLLASELQMRESDIDDDAQFIDVGLDSIGGVTWIRKINETYKTTIEATKVYSYPTLAQLSRYVQEEAEKQGTLARQEPAPAAASAARIPIRQQSKPSTARATLTSWRHRSASRFKAVSASADATQAIAVVGMAGQFPQARNLKEYWQNLAEGRNCITEVPRDRWDVTAYYQPGDAAPGKTNSQWLGALEDYDRFDPQFFNISPVEAESMDPQQRLFLQACWNSIENAGYDARSLSGTKCGVFVGCAFGDYHLLTREQQLSAQSFTGDATSILAARVSYFLNLHGPCLSIDTACSSSLVAIAQACESLNSGTSDLALAGGVYVMAGPEMHIRTAQAGMLSPHGKCFAFDQRADGFVPGEGVGVVMLKRLADAEKDGDIIYGVIDGWGVNQDGKTNGITAPNPASQTRLEQDVYDKYAIDPANIQLVEAHGTGTKLGDPIEVEGLKKAFQKYTDNKAYCALGSVKSNIGHSMTAAGIAGVIKLLLALKHRQLPPTINFERLNEHIDLTGSPFYVNNTLQEWRAPGSQRRQAAISSFGFSGTNVHLVIGDYERRAESGRANAAMPPSPQLVPLSARTAEQLRQKARDLLSFIRNEAPSIDLTDLAYTLQVGRSAMDERLGFVVSSIEQLTEKLEAYVNGDGDIRDFHQGQVKRNHETLSILTQNEDIRKTIVDNWIAGRKLTKLLEFWVKGLELDWSRLHESASPRRVSLPTYPFAQERYWIDTAAPTHHATTHNATLSSAAAVLHPLLHNNTSDLGQQSYSATFTGDEFFLTDHQVRADGRTVQKVLPGVAYLEMARAAIEHALPARPEATVLELRDTVWVQPIAVQETTQVSIALVANEHDQIDYEIYTQDGDQEIVHCEGRAVLSLQTVPAWLDLEQLKGQMGLGHVDPDSVYPAFARMGLLYGPAFQGLAAIHLGTDQVLAQLRLPSTVSDTSGDYVLHPSLMDSALQACVGLLEGLSEHSTQPRLPFALDSLRILAPCTHDMVAWVRYSAGSQAGDSVVKLDVDLCDERGNVCVQIHGFASRVASREVTAAAAHGRALGSLYATPVWQDADLNATAEASHVAYGEHHVVTCELPRIDAEQLASFVAGAQCLSLRPRRQHNVAQRYSDYALACFERIQRILKAKPQGNVLVQIVVADHEEQTLFAGLAALLKTAALENPQLVGQLLLVAPETTTGELARHVREEMPRALDTVIRYRNGGRQVLRWQEVSAQQEPSPIAFRDAGVYLITGGAGALGLLFAREILTQTRHARVVLTGRSSLTVEKQDRLDRLYAQPGRMTYRQVDLGDADAVRELIVSIEDEVGQLNGIVHSAGMIADNFILKKESGEFSDVLAPKVAGTFNLDQASRDVELDFFVLFSSIAGAMGNVGQVDYATANAFMDQFAALRNRQAAAGERYGRTRAVNWPLWQAGGLSLDRASRDLVQKNTGIESLQTSTGIEAFYRSLALPYDQILVAQGELAQMRRAFFGGPALPAEPEQPVPVAEIDPESLLEKTQEYLRRQLCGQLKLPASAIDPLAPLETYGIDSILALKLTNHLEQTFGSLSKTLFFEYQTVRELTRYFIQSHSSRLTALFADDGVQRQAKPVTAPPPTLPIAKNRSASSRRFSRLRIATPSAATEPDQIAIVGLSGRYPEAIDLDAYWENLREAKDCITEVPKERWDWREYYSEDRTQRGHHYSKWGGFIAGVDEFDPMFFNIAPKDAKLIDPQERLFLQHAWLAIEDAGYTRARLEMPSAQDVPGQAGVYVGVMYNEYQLFGAEASARGHRLGVAGSAASIANRVSYALNLHGPSVTLDTMCSSSLTAIHFACQDLKLGRTSLAIAGGVNVSVHPNKYLFLSAGQFISSDGHCQSFGEGGDGYIPGEGVGVVVLKRLAEARRDGDHIYGVIRGSALNHGGKTNGYTVPNPQAQANAISRALAESQTDARHVSYVEAHGTGTKLGDPIEIAALSKAFQPFTQETGFCLVGSAKSNIGHCESAAGIAGLTKVLLQMRHRQIVPSLHSRALNPHIDFGSTPFIVNQTLRTWEQPVVGGRTLPRIAGVSSFGAGGSNAHLIVEEYQAPAHEPLPFTNVVIVLSARTAEQLRQKAADLLAFVGPRAGTIDLVSMAYTLQTGREAMDERLGLIVSSAAEIVEKLQAYLSGEQTLADVYEGQVKRNREALSLFSTDADLQQTIDKWIANNKLAKLLELWVKGLELDWGKLYGDAKPVRMSLPLYPFARERHWLDISAVRGAAPLQVKNAAMAVLHPLLHSNVSDLAEQRYRTTFTGDEPFLATVGGQKVLPAAVYLEMARAAIERSTPSGAASAGIELHDVVWGEPVLLGENAEVTIALWADGASRIEFEIYSERAERQIVHCQGSASADATMPRPRRDLRHLSSQMTGGPVLTGADASASALQSIERGNRQSLAHLRLPNAVQDSAAGYVLHPSLLEAALEAAAGFITAGETGQAQELLTVDTLRAIAPCHADMAAWIRYAAASSADAVMLDIDLCDAEGNVCVELRGARWQAG